MRSLISAIKDSEIKLIHISTKDVFGNVYSKSDVEESVDVFTPHFLIDDSQPFAPETIYGKTKLMAEYIAESHPLTNVIRLSSCYTDFDHHRGHWIPNIIKSLLKKNPVTITNKGKQVRDILHVNDLGQLIIKIIESDKFGEKINIGGGPDNLFSVLQIINMVDLNAKIIEAEGNDYGFAFNNRLVMELFNWTPKILFEENLSVLKENLIKGKTAIS
jgi:nucleoside-diphosphate-sugar epimerase